MAGVKEAKEVLVGVNELSIFLISILKDGFQASEDISAIIAKITTDSDFRAKLIAAYEGIQAMPEEIKDIDLAEGLELGMVQFQYVPKILDALKK